MDDALTHAQSGPAAGTREYAPLNGEAPLPKVLTGIEGLDAITLGGLPRGRPTLICGSAGCGKTLFALRFLVRGATQFGEPGAYITFEETEQEPAQNVRSLGFDVTSSPPISTRGPAPRHRARRKAASATN